MLPRRSPANLREIDELIENTRQLQSELESAVGAYPNADSVRLPFHSAHRAGAGQVPSIEQQATIPWRKGLALRNEQLRSYFVLRNREQVLGLLPLMGFGTQTNFGYEISSAACLKLFDREIKVLEEERQMSDSISTASSAAVPNPSPPNLTDAQKVALRQMVSVYRDGDKGPFIYSQTMDGTKSLIYQRHDNLEIEADDVDLEQLRIEGFITLTSTSSGGFRGKVTERGIRAIDEPGGPSPVAEDPNSKRDNVENTVFIGHGGSRTWKDLRDFLRDRLHLKCDEFNGEPVAGRSTTQRLQDMLESATFAFLVMTGEDEQPDGRLRARENVIHEVGLFQGKLGFEKAIILLEQDCSRFSNIDGLTYISFPKGNIMAVAEEIRRVLEREGVLDPIYKSA